MSAGIDAVRALASMLKVLGTNGLYTRAKEPGTPAAKVRMLLSHVSPRDEALVNAYGVDAVILTFDDNSMFRDVNPEKFDAVTIGDSTYVFNAVHPIQLDDVRVGWTAYSKGKGA